MFFSKKEKSKKELSKDILSKIKRIKIFTKRLMKSNLSGDYLSAFKGSGLEFDQIREYQIGDDIRSIDWNSSAKMNKMMIKQLIEERDRTVILAIDVSPSSIFTSKHEFKKDLMQQVAACLTFISSENKDRVGALFFTDRVEKWIPPSRGNTHIAQILENIFSLEPNGKGTDIEKVLSFLVGLKKRNTVVFMLSDWIDEVDDYSKILRVVACEYDFVGIRFLDECEKNLQDVGLLDIQDLESGQHFVVDTKKRSDIDPLNLNVFLRSRLIEQKRLFEKYRVDLLDLMVGQSFINPMINFFKLRIRRQI